MTQKSNLVLHAEKELAIARGPGEVSLDGMDKLMEKSILDVVKKFSSQGHSGFSASWAINRIEKLLRFEPITPLTGDESEWMEVSGDPELTQYQNVRCSRVFKDVYADGTVKAYDIDGKVFVDKNGSTWTNRKSRTYITFPYVPKTKYVQRRWWKFWL